MIECRLLSRERQTAFGGLCVLGHHLVEEGILRPLSGVEIDQKTVVHSPTQKLTDALMGILSGCSTVYEMNFRLRPDLPLQRAFGRDGLADQSTVQRTLDAFTQQNVNQLREAVEVIGGSLSRLPHHDFGRAMLVVEVDLTGLSPNYS